jgi:hypothetical protein
MAKPKTDVAVAEKENTAMANYEGYEEDSGGGLENTEVDELLVPYLTLLQGLSPEVQEDGVAGAKPGMIYNPATTQLFSGKEGVVFIPCFRQHLFVEWQPRSEGGGFVGVHHTSSDVVLDAKDRSTDFGKFFTPEGNILAETYYLFGLTLDEEENPTKTVISFASTKIKQYKQLYTQANSVLVKLESGRKVTPPLWAHKFRLKTVKTKNNEGEFFIYQVGWDGETAREARLAPDDFLYKMGKAFKIANDEGDTKVDHGQSDGASASSDEDTEIPF